MNNLFRVFSNKSAQFLGTSWAFVIGVIVSIAWIFFDTQLDFLDIISLLTFMFLFLIQATQNRNDIATHAKLDELIRSQEEAQDDLIELEDQSDDVIQEVRKHIREQSKTSS